MKQNLDLFFICLFCLDVNLSNGQMSDSHPQKTLKIIFTTTANKLAKRSERKIIFGKTWEFKLDFSIVNMNFASYAQLKKYFIG